MIPGEIDCGLCSGELIIDGINMHTRAWCAPNLLPLWLPSSYREDSEEIPGVPGATLFDVYTDLGRYSLPFWVSGVVDPAGNWNENGWLGFEENLDYLASTVGMPPAPGSFTPTRPAVLNMPSGAMRTANVQSWIVPGDNVGPVMVATLELRVEGGVFA